jgi:uncharacterized protein
MALRERLQEEMKTAMREKSPALSVIRFIQANIKQQEVDQRIILDDAAICGVLQKLVKQREQAIAEAKTANRADLIQKEEAELAILHRYLPQSLSREELEILIQTAIQAVGATSQKDMGKIMASLKEKIAGRADMRYVSERVKSMLSSVLSSV